MFTEEDGILIMKSKEYKIKYANIYSILLNYGDFDAHFFYKLFSYKKCVI